MSLLVETKAGTSYAVVAVDGHVVVILSGAAAAAAAAEYAEDGFEIVLISPES